MSKKNGNSNGQQPENGLTVQSKVPPALPFMSPEEHLALLKKEMATIGTIRFPRLPLPSGKSAAVFDLTPLGLTDETTKQLDVIVLHAGPRKAWFEESFAKNPSAFPACFSNDGIHGQSGDDGKPCQSPTGLCADCPKNKFGTQRRDDGSVGKGKDCRDTVFCFFLLGADNALPALIRVPSTSLKNMDDYKVRLAGNRRLIWQQKTIIKLEKDKSGDGIEYYKLTFKEGENLSVDDMKILYSTYQLLLPQLEDERMERGDFVHDDFKGTTVDQAGNVVEKF